MPPELEEICRRAKEHFQVATAMVTVIDQDKQIVLAQAGTELEETPRSEAFCDHTIRTNDAFVVPDATTDARFAANPLVTGDPFIRFYAGAPLVYPRQISLGALCLLDPKPRPFTPEDEAELSQMADQALGIIMEQEFTAKFAAGH